MAMSVRTYLRMCSIISRTDCRLDLKFWPYIYWVQEGTWLKFQADPMRSWVFPTLSSEIGQFWTQNKVGNIIYCSIANFMLIPNPWIMFFSGFHGETPFCLLIYPVIRLGNTQGVIGSTWNLTSGISEDNIYSHKISSRYDNSFTLYLRRNL